MLMLPLEGASQCSPTAWSPSWWSPACCTKSASTTVRAAGSDVGEILLPDRTGPLSDNLGTMSFSDKLLLWLHIGFAIFAIGPLTALTSAAPRYIRARDLGVLR